jgi:hypothetical protein
MSQQLYRRCGCRDEYGRQDGKNCTKLRSDPKHGTWGYYLSHGSEPDPKDPGRTRRRQFRKAGYKTKTAAASAVAELRTRLDKGTYVKPTALTLGEYAQAWLPRRERSDRGLRPTTMASYGHYITDDIAPSALGRMKLTDIRRFHISEFVSDQAKAGRGTETVRKIATLLAPSLRALSRMS